MNAWTARVGLEIHVQLQTNTKLFCDCPTSPGPPNSRVCPVCYGLPGALPVPNRKAVAWGVHLARSLACRTRDTLSFDRKHYFYPDLPKGYQITQHRFPLATGGSLPLPDGTRVPIRQLHLEEDAGRSHHREQDTLLDFNRAGIPLVELVTEPVLHDGTGAADAVRMVRMLVRHLKISSGDMETGAIRCDANVSLATGNGISTGPVELKNLNAMRFLRRAVDAEIHRQQQAVSAGRSVEKETRFYDEQHNQTTPGRKKEDRFDYRYLPEPDIPPVSLAEVTANEPTPTCVWPWDRHRRWVRDWGVPEDKAWLCLDTPELAAYVEAVIQESGHPTLAVNRIVTDLRHALKTHGLSDSPPPVPGSHLARIVQLEAAGTLTDRNARSLIAACVKQGRDPDTLIRELRLDRHASDEAVRDALASVLSAHPAELSAIRSGKRQVIGFLVGQVMRRLHNRADPRTVRKLIEAVVDDE